jgi:hypothetical protein
MTHISRHAAMHARTPYVWTVDEELDYSTN